MKTNKKIGIIIQARMGSSRLPNKIMSTLGEKTVLEHVVDRCKKTKAHEVIIATSTNLENNIIERFCKKNKIKCFRGSENDVLNRYYQAAKEFNLNVIIRVTSDCPLIEPEIIDKLIDRFSTGDIDYYSNTIIRSFPRGLDCEIFNFKSLEKANKLAIDKQDREHVTLFIFKNPEIFKLEKLIAEKDLAYLKRPEIRLTIDTSDDLKLLRILFENLKINNSTSIKKIINFLDSNIKLIKINIESEKEHLKRYKKEDVKQSFI